MKKNKIFLFFGPPGAGKGTLAQLCVKNFGWLSISTGDILRDQIQRETNLGKSIKATIAAGNLVSDEIVTQVVEDWLVNQKNLPEGIIIDGYPRTRVQAEAFYKLTVQKLNRFELCVVQLMVNIDILIQRVINRVICSNKNCGKIYSLAEQSHNRSQVDMICDVCKSPLIRRLDDTKESFQKRLAVYDEHEQEVLNFYQEQGLKIQQLDGMQDAQAIFDNFKNIVSKLC